MHVDAYAEIEPSNTSGGRRRRSPERREDKDCMALRTDEEVRDDSNQPVGIKFSMGASRNW